MGILGNDLIQTGYQAGKIYLRLNRNLDFLRSQRRSLLGQEYFSVEIRST